MRAELTVVQGPSAREAAAIQRDMAQAARDAAQAARDAARAQVEAAQTQAGVAVGGEGNVSVTRDAQGRTVVRTGDRTITIDPEAVPSIQGQEALIHEALSNMPPPMPGDVGPPQNVIVLTGLVMFFLTLMLIGFPIARAMARRIDKRAAGPTPAPDMDARLQRIEHAVDAIAVEVERVSEGQRFATRLLSERGDADAPVVPAREGLHAR
jgi:hypothetical protein